MKIALYSPYLDTAGGGEKYMLTAAEVLSQKHQVSVLLDQHLDSIGIDTIRNKIKKLHQIDFSKIKFIKAPIGKDSSFFGRLFFLKKFDVFIYLTDGSIFLSTAKKNIIHFQVPFKNTQTKSLWGKIKLSSWNLSIYNSDFTRKNVENTWSIKGEVIYPPVSTNLFKSLKKKNQIISVGRFFGSLKEKKQELLINTFKELVDDKKLIGWSLHLVGAAEDGDKIFLDQLEKQAKGYKVFIHPNLGFAQLIKLYEKSSIYWHAMGFDEEDPTRMEHFGIVVVEAMAAGCIPVVVNKGGLIEIVEDKKSGFLWNNLNELKELTLKCVENEKLTKQISQTAIQRSKLFSKENFTKKVLNMVEK